MRSNAHSVLSLRPSSQPLPAQARELTGLNPGAVARAEQELTQVEYVPDELILGVEGPELSTSQALQARLGGVVVESFAASEEHPQIVRVKLPPEADLAKAMAAARELPGVAYAEPNQVVRLQSFDEPTEAQQEPPKDEVPNDLKRELWGLDNKDNPGADISAREAWQVTTGSRQGPLIAILDSGADYNHPDLKANIAVNTAEKADGRDTDGNGVVDDIFGFNAFEGHGDPMDGMGHGTHVTGTIAAVGNNGEGSVGVNWEAQVLPVKIFHDRGLTTTDAILRGISYAQSRGAVITSNSWGGPSYSQAIHDAFAANPALHIAAAGNDSKNTDEKASFPANYDLPNMISVGASNRQDAPSWFTNHGRKTVDLFAPGEEIYSTLPGGGYGSKSGTSMATPHVTGVAGLVMEEYPELTTAELKDRLLYSTDPTESVSSLSVTGGRLNAAQALSNDQVAPAAPNDFLATQTHPRGARFSWTNTGDDGWRHGPATGFEVRVSEQPITADNWDAATPLSTPRGQAVGDHVHAYYQQDPRSNETRIYAGFQALDEAGNRSELLTSQADLPASPIVFRDGFDGQETSFRGDNRWKRVEVPGRGQVWSSRSKVENEDTFSTILSPKIDLSRTEDSFLRFESRQDFSWSNNVFVELSEDGSDEWTRLDDLNDKGEWREREYDLSAYDGKKIQIRIRSENLGAKEGDGMMLDNFEVLGNPNLPV